MRVSARCGSASPRPSLRGLDADQLRQRLVSGTPDQVAERLRGYLDAGADGFTMSLRGVSELRPVELATQAARAAYS
jgi:alkanesulfonate monooxygenase SsuD/methylene tetrahydromethanopterin reductase-like flavin-dependent oxidoreductase (luciferase family)